MNPPSIPETRKVSYYLIYFLIISMQIGIGVLGFQRIVAEPAGHDAWIAVLVSGLSIHIILFLQFKILEYGGGDIIQAHRMAFGKWIGNVFSLLFALYFTISAITILRTYLEVVQVWMFQELELFWISLAFLVLIYYIVSSGFRTVTGVAFFGTVLPSYLVFTFAFIFPFSDFSNLLPIFDTNIKELAQSSLNMSLTYIGYETMLMFYPFIKDPNKSKKWAHLGILTVTLFYTIVTALTFTFFSKDQLKETVWATLSIWKIAQLPFIERIEYIGIGNWILIILPNLCITLWCGSRIVRQITHLRQRKALFILCLLVLVAVTYIEKREHINNLNTWLGRTGFYLNYAYVPILLVILLVVRKVRSKNVSKKQQN
ncbi:spore germination protein (amino acid permease) [Bacillus oleivorans]|uniref:Spore germination protein (Amino acid permease) n=1 Tax=Bacillus oleivorans TaxID=1448271 RepID=A0A285CZS0_9BACI|nr:GerAB/ArcD/ProY family transporter [Bacillus oleivorans]SNX72433.1 spore germination protein (amino acid permease) [Bacillus oleivorans]